MKPQYKIITYRNYKHSVQNNFNQKSHKILSQQNVNLHSNDELVDFNIELWDRHTYIPKTIYDKRFTNIYYVKN